MNEIKFNTSNLEDLFNGLQDLVYITDPKRRIILANQAFADIFRCSSPDELKGKYISDLYVVPKHRNLFEESLRIRGGRVVNYFVYVKRSTDEPFCLSVDSNWINYIESNGIQGTGRDLTDLVNFLGGFFQVNLQGVLTFCSPLLANIFGFTGPEFLIGKKAEDLISETRTFLEICQEAALNSNGNCLLNAKRYTKEGIFLPMRIEMNVIQITQIVKGSLEVVGYQGTFEDVTSAEETRNELKESHRMLELLTAKSQDGVYVIQGENLKLINPTFCFIVERNENELKDTPYLDLIHPEDRNYVRIEVERKLSGEDRPPYDFRILTKTRGERTVRAFSGHCTMKKVDSVYGYLRDITDEQQHEKELKTKIEERTYKLEESLEYQRSLLDTVVHEIDAPAVAIRGIVERLISGIARDKMDIPKQILKLRDIHDLCHLLFVLEKNVILAEAEEMGGAKNVKFWHLEKELINKAVNFMKPLLRNRDLPLDCIFVYLSGIPSYLKVNGDLFLQVFFNLLSNAIKCAYEDPNKFRIEIKSEFSSAKGITLYFSDWGIGVPENDLNVIFEKRKRGTNVINSPGMGLGLWVTKRILSAYNSTITVERRFQPTTFAIKIPNFLIFDKKPEGELL